MHPSVLFLSVRLFSRVSRKILGALVPFTRKTKNKKTVNRNINQLIFHPRRLTRAIPYSLAFWRKKWLLYQPLCLTRTFPLSFLTPLGPSTTCLRLSI